MIVATWTRVYIKNDQKCRWSEPLLCCMHIGPGNAMLVDWHRLTDANGVLTCPQELES